MICQAGSYAAGIHLIVEGAVSDVMVTAEGERRDSNILGPGDLIGLEVLEGSSDKLSISLCRALTRVELLFVERSLLESALENDPVLRQEILRYSVSRYVLARRNPRQQVPAKEQLCCLLLRLGEVCGVPVDGGRSIVLPEEITLRTLGELSWLSSRQLRHARQAIRSLEGSDVGVKFSLDEARQIIDAGLAATD